MAVSKPPKICWLWPAVMWYAQRLPLLLVRSMWRRERWFLFIGIIFGAIPGMNGNLAITVLLPFTFQMDTVPALLMLTAIFFGSNFGGSISAILINTPGTNAAAATLIDGYPMCKKGQPQRALDMALVASATGGLISAFCLLFFAPQISKIEIGRAHV